MFANPPSGCLWFILDQAHRKSSVLQQQMYRMSELDFLLLCNKVYSSWDRLWFGTALRASTSHSIASALHPEPWI